MPYRTNPLLAAVAEPPIAEAYGWIKGKQFPADKPLIDVSQAVPGYPPPPAPTDHLASCISEPAMARYTDIKGPPELRAALAADIADRQCRRGPARWRATRQGHISAVSPKFRTVHSVKSAPVRLIIVNRPTRDPIAEVLLL